MVPHCGEASEAAEYIDSGQEAERKTVVPILTSPLHLVQDASLWDGTAHIEGGSSFLGHTSLETSLPTHPVVCFHGDSKCSRADKENVPPHHPIYTSHSC